MNQSIAEYAKLFAQNQNSNLSEKSIMDKDFNDNNKHQHHCPNVPNNIPNMNNMNNNMNNNLNNNKNKTNNNHNHNPNHNDNIHPNNTQNNISHNKRKDKDKDNNPINTHNINSSDDKYVNIETKKHE